MRFRVLLPLGLVLTMSASARADDERDAQRAYEQGQEAFNAGRYDEAIRAFQRADELAPAPENLFNIAQAQRLMGRCVAALDSYRRYLEAAPDSPSRAQVEGLAAEMERCVADREAASPPVAPAPEPEPEPEPAERWEDVDTGKSTRLAGLVIVGAGAVIAATGYYMHTRANAAEDEIGRLYAEGGTWNEHYADVYARGERDASVSAVLYGVGAFVAVAGGVTWAIGNASHRRQMVTLAPVPSGTEVVWTWDF